MVRRKIFAVAVAAFAMMATVLPADAQAPSDYFGVSVLEGPGTITSAPNATRYRLNDPLWTQCKAALQALNDPGLPANPNGGVFFPCFGPPAEYATTHFKGEGTSGLDPASAASFCASTAGPCISESVGFIGGNEAGGVLAGAYCGSSKGTSVGTFKTTNPPDSPLGNVSYSYKVAWAQSGATILPLVGEITAGDGAGATIVGFVSSRTTNDSRGTCGRPSTSGPASGQLTFAVDGMAAAFNPAT